jgi:hypothetical protein
MAIILARSWETAVEHEPRRGGIVVWAGNGKSSPTLGGGSLMPQELAGFGEARKSRLGPRPSACWRLLDARRSPGSETV